MTASAAPEPTGPVQMQHLSGGRTRRQLAMDEIPHSGGARLIVNLQKRCKSRARNSVVKKKKSKKKIHDPA